MFLQYLGVEDLGPGLNSNHCQAGLKVYNAKCKIYVSSKYILPLDKSYSPPKDLLNNADLKFTRKIGCNNTAENIQAKMNKPFFQIKYTMALIIRKTAVKA